MDNNFAPKESKVKSAEIIEYAKQMISEWDKEYRGAESGKYDSVIIRKMIDGLETLMNTAIKAEALEILSKLPTSDDGANREIASAVNVLMSN